MNPVPVTAARDAFKARYGTEPQHIVYAPGRVNLIGEHTDYNDGYVLPCAIGFGTAVAIGPADAPYIDVMAADINAANDCFSSVSPMKDCPPIEWTRHVRGVAAVLVDAGFKLRGAKIAISGNVPQGAGLSSSASLGVALGLAFKTQFGLVALAPVQIALTAQKAENEHVGCACGIMDQLASACAQAEQALLIDCRSLSTRLVAIPPGAAILIVHSGVRRELAESAYNDRRLQCDAVAQHFGVNALRDVTLTELEAEAGKLPDVQYRRARHVITENARTLAAADALERGDLFEMGQLMAQSHMSMRDDFEITVEPVDRLVALLQRAIGEEGGARMTGGGFGGCVVAIMKAAKLSEVVATVKQEYRTPDDQAPMIIETQAAGGARLIT
ncbi:MAG: galactokinase [Sphingorhabdus sp.]